MNGLPSVTYIYGRLSLLQYLIPDQYSNYYKVLEVYTGYIDSLVIMILFSSQ